MKEIKVGSLFSGIGGMELGLSRAIPNLRPVWFCEQNTFGQSILSKHWSGVPIYDDVRNINKSNVESIDILTGGFPCQDISVQGNKKGVNHGEKSGLWWEMWRIIGDLRPRIVIMENVSNILRLGGTDVVGSLAEIGYCVEWEIVSARQFGAPHLRKRWFGVAYLTDTRRPIAGNRTEIPVDMATGRRIKHGVGFRCQGLSTFWNNKRPSDFEKIGFESSICRVDDGIPPELDKTEQRKLKKIHNERLKSLGNAIVPACSEYVGRCIVQSGLLDDFFSGGEQ